MKATDISIKNVEFSYEDFHYRTPIKFGGVALDRATILNVRCDVETRAGQHSSGFGSMPLGNVWSFPSKVLRYDQTLGAMKSVVEHIAAILSDCRETGHPIDLTWNLEQQFFTAADEVRDQMQLAEAIPHLCTLVCASPFDAALHDAYGKAHGRNCYQTYGPDFMNHDLGHYLGSEFSGESLEQYVRKEPAPTMPLYHLVGALDPLDESDLKNPLNDGMPEILGDWIRADGLTHLKIKLNGDDINWDVQRVLRVESVCAHTQSELGVTDWCYSLDFNERCPNVDYLLDLLQQLQRDKPEAFARIQYIEQPTARDLKANRQNVMHEAAKIRPVVIDESLVDLESLQMAREMGYTGAALKACKGQSQSLLLAAAAQKYGMFLCVQDLTCPGASFIHSAGLAAHIPGVAAIEGNARQYMPIANVPWKSRFPGIFQVSKGTIRTASLNGLGLSFLP